MSEIFGGLKAQIPLGAYQITDLDTAGATQYFGYTDKNGNWYIMQLTATAVRYAKGTTGYTTGWTNRALTVVYDYWYTTF